MSLGCIQWQQDRRDHRARWGKGHWWRCWHRLWFFPEEKEKKEEGEWKKYYYFYLWWSLLQPFIMLKWWLFWWICQGIAFCIYLLILFKYFFTALFTNMQKFKSSKAAFAIAFFAVVNHNYDHKQRTLKHRNTQNRSKSTNHKPWPFEPIKVKFFFLRGPLRWLTAAKNAIVGWLLNFRIRMFVKSAVITSSKIKLHTQPNLFTSG